MLCAHSDQKEGFLPLFFRYRSRIRLLKALSHLLDKVNGFAPVVIVAKTRLDGNCSGSANSVNNWSAFSGLACPLNGSVPTPKIGAIVMSEASAHA